MKNKKNDLLILGAGGVARDVIHILFSSYKSHFTNIYLLDDFKPKSQKINGLEIFGKIRDMKKFDPSTTKVAIAFGAPKLRRKFAEYTKKNDFNLFTIIDKSVIIKKPIKIEEGVIIFPNSIISQDTIIESNTLIDTNVVIGHDVLIQKNCVISPMSCILGNVIIESDAEIGCSLKFIKCSIGKFSKVGMGSSVYKDVPKLSTVAVTPQD